jgi:hypothetical protein
MWYVTFHGTSSDYNVCAYDDSGNLIASTVLEVSSVPNKAELRAIGFAPDGHLYVLNSHSTDSQVLIFSGSEESNHSRKYKGIFTSNNTVSSIVHPFGYAADPVSGNLFITSQDTNVVTQVYGSFGNQGGTAAPIAEYLTSTFGSAFLPGTFVASAYTNLPAYKNLTVTPVTDSQGGLDAKPHDPTENVKNSVRGIVLNAGILYVADEPGDAVRIYDGASGKYGSSITGDKDNPLTGPVHLLSAGSVVYIGSSGTNTVLAYDIANKSLSTVVDDKDLKSVSGLAFGADGNLYVADRKAMKVYKYAPGTTPFNPLGAFIGSGMPDEPEFLMYVAYAIAA